MKSTEVADKYAEALYELGKEGEKLDEIIEDIDSIARTVSEASDFTPFLTHPLVPNTDKIAILERVFGGKVSQQSINFLKILVERDREDYLQLISERLHKIRMDREEIIEVKVSVPPRFFHDGLKGEVHERLSSITDRSVKVTEISREEGLIGGMKLTIGEKVIDGTIRGQLEELREFILEGGKDGRN